MSYHIAVGLPTIIAVLASFLIPLAYLVTKSWRVVISSALIGSLATLLSSLYTFILTLDNDIVVYPFGGWPPPVGIIYAVDFFNATLGLLASALFTLILVYLIWYSRYLESGREYMITLLLLLHAGVLGCFYTGDIFNFFVMLEVICISSYALVSFFRRRKWAIEASISYSFVGALATYLYFLGVVFIYASYGTLNLADIAVKAQNIIGFDFSNFSGPIYGNISLSTAVALALIIWALNFESGVFPNNYWLPGAYSEAPSPVSAYFAGVVDKVGTYFALRLFTVVFPLGATVISFKVMNIPFRDVLLLVISFLGILTGYLGALLMTIQKDVKRLLSYSTLSHIGIMTMTFAALTSINKDVTELTVAAVVIYMIAHSRAESALFLGLGAFATITNSRKLEDLSGFGKVYHVLGISIVISLISLIGVPPFLGFFGKLLVFTVFMEKGLSFYAISIVIITGISAIGYFRVLHALYLGGNHVEKIRDMGIPSLIVLIAALSLLILGVLLVINNFYYLEAFIYKLGLSGNPQHYINGVNNIINILIHLNK